MRKASDRKGSHDRHFNIGSTGKDSFLTAATPRLLNRWLIFGVWVSLSLLLFAKPVFEIFHLANQDEPSSHIVLIPFIPAWFLYGEQKKLQSEGVFGIW